jgi:hypothetical protein
VPAGPEPFLTPGSAPGPGALPLTRTITGKTAGGLYVPTSVEREESGSDEAFGFQYAELPVGGGEWDISLGGRETVWVEGQFAGVEVEGYIGPEFTYEYGTGRPIKRSGYYTCQVEFSGWPLTLEGLARNPSFRVEFYFEGTEGEPEGTIRTIKWATMEGSWHVFLNRQGAGVIKIKSLAPVASNFVPLRVTARIEYNELHETPRPELIPGIPRGGIALS